MTQPSTSIPRLRNYIAMPIEPARVTWQVYLIGQEDPRSSSGFEDWELVAVLEYEDVEQVKQLVEGMEPMTPYIGKIPQADVPWLPREAREAFAHLNAGKDVPAVKWHNATPFYDSPFLHGIALVQPGEKYIVIALHTM